MHNEPPSPEDPEIDVEVDDPDVVEELGSYPSVDAYLQAQIEDHFLRGGLWLLDCLDMVKVRARFEGGGRWQYMARAGKVYRIAR